MQIPTQNGDYFSETISLKNIGGIYKRIVHYL